MAKKNMTYEDMLKDALNIGYRPYNIPDNWVWVNSIYVFDIEYGKNLPVKKLINSGYKVYGANGPIGFYNDYTCEKEKVLMSCRGAYSGTINFSEPFSFVTNNSLIITPKLSEIDNLFIGYMFQAMDKNKLISGSAQPQVTVKSFKNFPIPLPPLFEQQRIVMTIQNLFSKLDRAKELIIESLESFKYRRSAILHKAFTGELTARWREENGVSFDSWEEKKLIDVLQEKPRNGYSPKGVEYKTAYRNLTLSATTSGYFKEDCYKYVDINIEGDSYLWLKKNDILIQRANSLEYVGATAIYDGEDDKYIYPDLMMKIKVDYNKTIPKFTYYILSDISTKYYFRKNASGTAGNMPKINQKIVSNTPFPCPTLTEQKQIVVILDELLGKEDKAKELTDLIYDIDMMKKAILAKAFRGELGTNEPTEESAMELIKKIVKDRCK